MNVEFRIFRQTAPDAPPSLQPYSIDVNPKSTILDALTQIKWEQDGSLAFRKNCRNTICGSCAMRINDRAGLACQLHIDEALAGRDRILIGPMGNLPVVKDLVVDMQAFWTDLKRVDPYVSTASRTIPEREFIQLPQERNKLNQMGNCIMCGACYSDCNAKEVNPGFVGPHALAKANRVRLDTRDDRTAERVRELDNLDGVWGCTRCQNCNDVCPMEVAPLDQITKIKQATLAISPPAGAASRAVRHRKTMVSLVKQGGWVDERKFGVAVVGNYFRDLKGLLSLVPLGLGMVTHGKFPTTFEASEGTAEVRRVIEAAEGQS
ncbi:succinate dehydrogenase/fumarate reductase iron-sulfur subunit [Synechococcus sp. PCC 7336]|uniref:succinate dehydrogenase/fumarate reductase iron-sulfur subunit n=1 Tax=Synechococcus sp. PCC 7336 TaxID=195250 RepID=UPI00034BD8F3|nr:succinate dehydrogenase/fumarate reductase iron-sulfur subunit [Synechococcus sp. PCC 7336]